MSFRLISTFAIVLLLVDFALAQDWPRWRGANQDDISTAVNLMQEWPEAGPEKVWVYDNAGLGYAGFSIVGDRLFTMGVEDDDNFALCLNAETGERIWQTSISSRFRNGWGDGPRSTPTVDDDRVYFMAPNGDLCCLSLDGDVIWSRRMQDFGGTIPEWGFSESPLVAGDLVFCTPGGDQGAILALNKMTGDKVWQCEEVTSIAHYSTILLAEHNGSPQLIQLLVDKVVGVSPDDGSFLWEVEFHGKIAVIPSPIYSNGSAYVTAGYGVGSKRISIGENQPVEEYYSRAMVNHHGGVILKDGHLYGFSDRKGFVCQNFESGEMVWNVKNRSVEKGAVAWADGRFYYVEEPDGEVLLIDANPDEFVIKGRFTLTPQSDRRDPDGRVWVHPVIANGKMYLRDQEFIHCYNIANVEQDAGEE